MSISKPTLTKPWASDVSANRADPGGVNDTGIPADGKSIPRRWLNWVLNKVDAATRYLVARGIPDWDANEVYTENDRVQWTDGNCYRLRMSTATGNDEDPSHVLIWEPWAYSATQFISAFTTLLEEAFPDLFAAAFGTQFPISMNGLTTGPTSGDVAVTVGTVSNVQGFTIGRVSNRYGMRLIALTVTDCGTPNGYFDVLLQGSARITGPKGWVVCTQDVVMNIFPRVFVQALGADVGGVTTDVIRVDWQNSGFANGPHPTVNIFILGTPAAT